MLGNFKDGCAGSSLYNESICAESRQKIERYKRLQGFYNHSKVDFKFYLKGFVTESEKKVEKRTAWVLKISPN